MYATLPPRRWCREVLALQAAVGEMLGAGIQLTDPRMLVLSRRLNRLMLVAINRQQSTAAQTGPPERRSAANAAASNGRRSVAPSPTPM